MKIRLILVLSAIAAFCAFSTPVQAADPNDPVALPPPCAPTEAAAKEGVMAGLKTCKAFFEGEGGRPGFNANLKALLKTHIDKILANDGSTGIRPCVLVLNPFVLKNGQQFSEDKVDRFGQSCGNPMTVTIQTHPLVVQFNKQPPVTGTLEDGWIDGASVTADAFYYSQVAAEIASTGKFTARYVTAMAHGYLDTLARRNTLFTIVGARTNTKDLLSAVSDCKKTEDGTDTTQSFDVGLQAAELCSGHKGLERTYLNIAVADILGRAADSYADHLGSVAAHQALYTWIQSTMKMVCRHSSVNDATQCYKDNIASKMRDYITGVWPLSSAVASVPSAPTQARNELLTPWFLMAAGLRRRKRVVKSRRRKAASRPSGRSFRRFLRPLCNSLLVALGGAFLTACPGGVSSSTPTQLVNPQPLSQQCPWGASVYLADCCSDTGSLCTVIGKDGCKSTCDNVNHKTSDQTTAAITTGADDMTATRASLDNAAVLLGIPTDALGGPGGGDSAIHSAALAGAQLGSHTNTPTDGSTPGSPSQNALVAAGAGGLGSDTPGSGSQSGSNSNIFGSSAGSGSGTNLSLPGGGGGTTDAQKEANAASAGADGKGGGPKGTTYGGGGAKHMGEDGNVDPSSFFGELGGDRGPANQDAVFGKLDGTKPMGTADPDDYFTRTGLDENIFRIVSRRYRAKAFTWASVQSQASFQNASQAATKK